MSIPLLEILRRLAKESLSGPMISIESEVGSRNNLSQDLDCDDPRWLALLMEYFIHIDSTVSDDLLFFVRKLLLPSEDTVLVRRRIAGQPPTLNEQIDWKQSFFLNMICQQPCTLTATICTKSNAKMTAHKRITKKVYAAPFKSRMDIKDAVMNECSYPLVYYTINDFESDTLHLPIFQDEYFCVQLSTVVPIDPGINSYCDATEKVQAILVNDDNNPFPTPEGYEKVILFQGAVSFNALCQAYQQKGQNNIEQGYRHRTEYIQMKAPLSGDGHCQG